MAIVLFIIFVVLMAVGVPIAISMAASSILYMIMFVDIPLVVIAQQMLAGVNKYTLLAIPFFHDCGFSDGTRRDFQTPSRLLQSLTWENSRRPCAGHDCSVRVVRSNDGRGCCNCCCYWHVYDPGNGC